MLFDLRSRGRRRTVQAVYLGLAVLMGGGLVLFGVGTGNGFGGLLDAVTGGGGGTPKPVVSQAEQNAVRQTQLYPNDPSAWAALVQARWDAAKQSADYNPNTQTFGPAGRKELAGEAQAWQRYTQLTKHPDSSTAILAARAYGYLGDYSSEAQAWETVTLANPADSHGFQCLAVASYAAGEQRKGDLAAAKAVSLLPQAQSSATKQTLQQAKSQPQTAKQYSEAC